jgi:hypothetical protein
LNTKQLAEAAPGSVEALSRAFGFGNDTGAFRKRVEQGGLQLDAEKARAFAKELSTIAKEGGALDKVTQKTNAQMQRFFNALTKGKEAVFQGGMDEGLSFLFKNLSDVIKGLTPLASSFGAAFSGMSYVVTMAIRTLISPFQALGNIFSSLGIDDQTSGMIWKLVGGGGALYLMAKGIRAISAALATMNIQLAATAAILAPVVAGILAIEDFVAWTKGKDSVTGRLVEESKSNWFVEAMPITMYARSWQQQQARQQQPVVVHVIPQGDKFDGAIKAEVDKTKAASAANLQLQLEN